MINLDDMGTGKVDQDSVSEVEKELIQQNESLISAVEKKNTELVKTERLATIGTMASRIAHDLKNPLTIMQTYSDMLTPEILSKLDYTDREKWLRMQNSILDMNRIIEDVLDFARTTEIKKSPTSFLNILKLAMNNVKSSYGIRINLPKNDFTINCDARKIEGVLSNLISNSVQALDGNGEIDIDVNSNSEFLSIQIKDSGPGITEENLEKIFEPMFTTKTTGTGLGLVICKSIVEQHGGIISVSNKPTTFTIKLPLKN
jgi:signal transduction histidine kinase